MGSVTTITATFTAMLVTGLVGRFGTAALAGYSIGMRLEFMLAPLAFGIGTGATTLVGIAAGAGDWRRAVQGRLDRRPGRLRRDRRHRLDGRVAARDAASRLFASDPDVIAASIACIVHVAPFYCLFGLGLTLNFASQGAGRMTVPVIASVVALDRRGGRRLACDRGVRARPRRRLHRDRREPCRLWPSDRRRAAAVSLASAPRLIAASVHPNCLAAPGMPV